MNALTCKNVFIDGFRISDGTEAPGREARTVLTEVDLLLSAVSGSLIDAGVKEAEREAMSVVLGIDDAIDGIKAEFFKGVVADGPLGASPVVFPYTSPNAIAARVTIAFAIKGEDMTFASGPLSFLKALSYGSFLVSNGFAGRVLVCGVTGGKAASAVVGGTNGGVVISEVLEYRTAVAGTAGITSMAETFVLFTDAYESAVSGGGSHVKAEDMSGNGIGLLFTAEASRKTEKSFGGIRA